MSLLHTLVDEGGEADGLRKLQVADHGDRDRLRQLFEGEGAGEQCPPEITVVHVHNLIGEDLERPADAGALPQEVAGGGTTRPSNRQLLGSRGGHLDQLDGSHCPKLRAHVAAEDGRPHPLCHGGLQAGCMAGLGQIRFGHIGELDARQKVHHFLIRRGLCLLTILLQAWPQGDNESLDHLQGDLSLAGLQDATGTSQLLNAVKNGTLAKYNVQERPVVGIIEGQEIVDHLDAMDHTVAVFRALLQHLDAREDIQEGQQFRTAHHR
mmetsp:Transcript_83193/g.138779  ORF Transcript_83193/g.138779 Transcript_83193/m.138779 type:complete len:266 (+) Transcript_83193:1831-2628(+)